MKTILLSIFAIAALAACNNAEEITFLVGARDLPPMDLKPEEARANSDPDPFCQVYYVEKGHESYLGRTDTLEDNKNPNFGMIFTVEWNGSLGNAIKMVFTDNDPFSPDDHIGESWVPMEELPTKGAEKIYPFTQGAGKGRIFRI